MASPSSRSMPGRKGGSAPDLRALHDVVGRLHGVIAEYLESGERLGIRLQPVEIVSALDAALAEADGRPSEWPDGGDARTFFVHGLYQEIIQQPSNVFETRVFPDGSERYIPVGAELWKVCLQRVRAVILAACDKA